jgi:hypothetical protein
MITSDTYGRIHDAPHFDRALESLDLLFMRQSHGTSILAQPYPVALVKEYSLQLEGTLRILSSSRSFRLQGAYYESHLKRLQAGALEELLLLNRKVVYVALKNVQRILLQRYEAHQKLVLSGALFTNGDVLGAHLAGALAYEPEALLFLIDQKYANLYQPNSPSPTSMIRHQKQAVEAYFLAAVDRYLEGLVQRLSQVRVGVFLPFESWLSRESLTVAMGAPIQWLPSFFEPQLFFGDRVSSGYMTLLHIEKAVDAMERTAFTFDAESINTPSAAFKNYLSVQRILSRVLESAKGPRLKSLAVGVFLLTHEEFLDYGGDVSPSLTPMNLAKFWEQLGRSYLDQSVGSKLDSRDGFSQFLRRLQLDDRETLSNTDLVPYTERELSTVLSYFVAASYD